MKAFADIDQSKRLADILPPESADMYYEPSPGFCTEPSDAKFGDVKYAHPRSIRCWSLVALLNVIPIEHNLHGYLTESGKVYRVETLYAGNSNNYDNPVDACYEMLLKLHEQNLL